METPAASDSVPSFEVAFDQLQKTVRQLESGQLSLENALKQFEEGVRLTRLCQEHLARVEQRIEILTQGNGLKPFAPPPI